MTIATVSQGKMQNGDLNICSKFLQNLVKTLRKTAVAASCSEGVRN